MTNINNSYKLLQFKFNGMEKTVGSMNLFFDNIKHENVMLLNMSTEGQIDSILII